MIKDEKNSLLIVDDDSGNIKLLVELFREEYLLYVAKTGKSAIEMAKGIMPDLILLDIILDGSGETGFNGFEVITALREIEATRDIPIVLMSGLDKPEDERRGLEQDVVDYITKPFENSIVKLRINNQIKMINYIRQIEHMGLTDALTGLNNRRSFNKKIDEEWARACREETVMSVIILDVDHFKKYNDTYGHQRGDVVLQVVANALTSTLQRATDFVARWGGEEFIILMPNTNKINAMQIADRIRDKIEQTKIPLPDGTITRITISAGVDSITPTKETPEILLGELISNADRALYTAKEQGRNRVIAF
ncbi:MAG: diguanylate cyclase [Defluviitaleaceae bacterium]|nr:diguanylate cyclase [Defluviitaleaceae bacterium]